MAPGAAALLLGSWIALYETGTPFWRGETRKVDGKETGSVGIPSKEPDSKPQQLGRVTIVPKIKTSGPERMTHPSVQVSATGKNRFGRIFPSGRQSADGRPRGMPDK
jgi:hypothetical protein